MKNPLIFSLFILLTTTMSVNAQNTAVGKVARVNAANNEILVSSPRAAEVFTLGSRIIIKGSDNKEIFLKIFFPMMSIAKCNVESGSLKYISEIHEGMQVFLPEVKGAKTKPKADTQKKIVLESLNNIKLPKTSFNLVFVEGKKFKSGIEDNEDSEVGRAYWIGETEITYDTWKEVYDWAVAAGYSFQNPGTMGTGINENLTGQHPVTMINWRDAIVWCNALTEFTNAKTKGKTLLDIVYYDDDTFKTPLKSSVGENILDFLTIKRGGLDNPFVKPQANGFRLPINSEWELAARYIADKNNDGILSGKEEASPGDFASGSSANLLSFEAMSEVAVFAGNSKSSTAPVKTKKPNSLGIYDMCGNVSEWCFEWFNGSGRVVRGGSWANFSDDLEVGNPGNPVTPVGYNSSLGFRIVRSTDR